jgi:LysM repeat protein
MKSWKRLFFYLLLNVLVSACTILVVLMIWDRVNGPLPRGLLPQALDFSRQEATLVPSVQTGSLPPAPVPTQSFTVYQVQAGDTFERLAQKFNISVEELLAVNDFTSSQPLASGQELRIPANPQGIVLIDGVIGAGDLETERVMLKHQGQGELSLAGWRLEDESGNVFVFPQFPQLTLYKDGAVNLYTKVGNNTVVDLYWGLTRAIWYPGATVILRDPQGDVRFVYKIP